MKVDKKYKGLVTKKFNQYYLVELDKDENSEFKKKYLCKIKKSVNSVSYTHLTLPTTPYV